MSIPLTSYFNGSFRYPKIKRTAALALLLAMSLLPSKLLPLHIHTPNPNTGLPYSSLSLCYPRPQTFRVICGKRTGKQRYPSEKKRLKSRIKDTLGQVKNKFEGSWRLSKLGVPVHRDPGKDSLAVSDVLLEEIAKVLEFPVIQVLRLR